jgi:uncharacterized protein (DUF433 family)
VVAEVKTEHPHIVVIDRAAGPCAVLKGTRTAVWFIIRQLRTGDTPEDIVATLPNLKLAAVYDAISYYHDHRTELDPIIEELDRLAAEERTIDLGA